MLKSVLTTDFILLLAENSFVLCICQIQYKGNFQFLSQGNNTSTITDSIFM